jgi:EAL domain-containing protein (putative c-di-GMP-specific phosphodiesterase class I)/FixJ family two-component response regulator
MTDERPRPAGRGRILVIDDAPEVTRVLRARLERDGYAVTVAEDGPAGLTAAAASPPDLILLDVMMPGIDGYEVCRQLRAQPATRLTPVVMLTAVADHAAVVRALDIGADDFIAKPFHTDELAARVRAHLRMRRLQALPMELAGSDAPELAELREAIASGQLLMYYQPKRAARDRRLVGVEALVRWQHPRRGLLLPGRFVPLAERTELARPLSECVLQYALAQCRAWSQSGADVPVAVNLCVQDAQDPDLPAQVMDLLARFGIPPAMLTLELTEGAVMTNPQRAIGVLTELRLHGIHVSLDDFGTGYSSLSYLLRLPVDELKIDQSFVAGLTTDGGSQAIVQSTIALAHQLDLRVVAEGVEDEPTWRLLAEVGCDVVQGFHVGLPRPAQELDRR